MKRKNVYLNNCLLEIQYLKHSKAEKKECKVKKVRWPSFFLISTGFSRLKEHKKKHQLMNIGNRMDERIYQIEQNFCLVAPWLQHRN